MAFLPVALALTPLPLAAQTTLTNTASAAYETIAGTDSVRSNPVQTALLVPDLFLRKGVTGATSAHPGEHLGYRFQYGNTSGAVPAIAAVLVDTLAQELEFVSSQPAAQVSGRVVTWLVGDLAPGSSGEITLVVRVSDAVRDTIRVRNSAILATSNAPPTSGAAPEVELIGQAAAQVTLEKVAEVLEVALGETAPYTLTLSNPGLVPLTDLRIHDRLPEGGRFARGSALGADSVQAAGRDLTIFVAGPLAPGDRHIIHYGVAIVSAESETLENTAFATAGDDGVRSATATARIRVQRRWPLETRAAIGAVWIDTNGDGKRTSDEPGVKGADIWSDDGEVVSTDAEGRFSFRNLRPGRHAFRLDPATVPSGYQVAGPGAAEDLAIRDSDGWTTPRFDFRLVSREGQLVREGTDAEPADSLRRAEGGAPLDSVSVPALRSAKARSAERRGAFLYGPGVEIFAPADGTVHRSDRAFVGVRGEPGAPVALFVGDSQVAHGNIRVDGIHDFIAVPLPAGPQVVRVRMLSSWQKERWDSIAVHVTDAPAKFDPERSPVRLVADGDGRVPVRVRVLDRWGVPVANRPLITASGTGAEVVNPDADASSVGTQVRADGTGWLTLLLRPGNEPGQGSLALTAGTVEGKVGLEILPTTRPLMVNGVGRVGVGASPDAFGSVLVRGVVDSVTSVLVNLDSRRLDAGRDAFGRSSDPLEEAQYPILGDASRQRAVTASRSVFSARLQRRFDQVTFGDLATADFASGLRLGGYRRALTGLGARVATGRVGWQMFASSTRQSLQQAQIRGAGISGPYPLQPDIQLGTEQIAVETRALENPQRILSRQVLIRYVDYQIDYGRGTLLLRQPVPAADTYGNPVFLVVTYEAESGGARNAVWGLRASTDARSFFSTSPGDSLRVGATWIRDGGGQRGRHLGGADVRLLTTGGLDLSAELSHAQAPDSSGLAATLDGALHLFDDALRLSAGWLKTGSHYQNPSNVGLRGGSEEVRIGGRTKLGRSELRLEHERQTFEQGVLGRSRSSAGILQRVGQTVEVDALVAADHSRNGALADGSRAGEVKLSWTPTTVWRVWTESRRQFSSEGAIERPDYVGAGAAFQITRGVALEARHRRVFLRDEDDYSLTNLGVRSRIGAGTEVWGSYQLAGADGAYNAAVVGLNNRLRLGRDWSVNALVERRTGVARAAVTDPVRALPFLQAEENYWSVGFGTEYLPPDAPYRASARTEARNGDARSTRLLTVAGDVSLSRSFAVLSRQEFVRTEQLLMAETTLSRQYSSLWGLALRPIRSDALNVLAKIEWLDAVNPLGGGVLSRQGHEARTTLAAEAIWAPLRVAELGGRYARRRTAATRDYSDGVSQRLGSTADFFGGRTEARLARWLALRGEGRLLLEHSSGTQRGDLAPQIVFLPVQGLELAGGHRFGTLRDPDFAVNGGHGWFVTMGVRFTEKLLPTAGDFWRDRFGQR